jgi:hypothetical protein
VCRRSGQRASRGVIGNLSTPLFPDDWPGEGAGQRVANVVLDRDVGIGDDVATDFCMDIPRPTGGEVKGFADRGDGGRRFGSEIPHEAILTARASGRK